LRRSRYSLSVVLATLATLSILNLTAQREVFAKSADRDGIAPAAGLTMDTMGNIYGTTSEGGAYLAGTTFGAGTVFELTPPTTSGGSWTESILLSFKGADGIYPAADLIMDKGNLYGTTLIGGANAYGAVFELTPPTTSGGSWTESTLLSFDGTDGLAPHASLIMDTGGNLYGTTEEGGANGDGTVFELAPPSKSKGKWAESVLWSFDGRDGTWPYVGFVMDAGGNLHGTAFHGGASGAPGNGTIFQLTPPATKGGSWTESPPYSFTGGTTDGVWPVGLIMNNGNLYGTTRAGGQQGKGTVFELTASGTESVLWNFGNGTDGQDPYRGPIADANGNLYGTTQLGGTNNDGTVFELSPPTSTSGGTWTEAILHSFGGTDGAQPLAGLMMDTDSTGKLLHLYGTTGGGGTDGFGTVYKLTPPAVTGGSWTESVLYSFM